MPPDETISQAYQAHRPYLVDLAFRMLARSAGTLPPAITRLMAAAK